MSPSKVRSSFGVFGSTDQFFSHQGMRFVPAPAAAHEFVGGGALGFGCCGVGPHEFGWGGAIGGVGAAGGVCVDPKNPVEEVAFGGGALKDALFPPEFPKGF